MMETIQSLLEALTEGQLLETIAFPSNDDEILRCLDRRDKVDFCTKWMAAFQEVENKKKTTPITPENEKRVFELRRNSYLQAFKRWNSSDFAAYISDDFGLIGDALALDVVNPWIQKLLYSYLGREIPVILD